MWEDTVQATVQWSCICHNISVLHLIQNVRLNHNAQQIQFTQWLLRLGYGNTIDTNTASGSISLPSNIVCTDQDNLIHLLYSSTPYELTPLPQYFYDRVLLIPLNDNVYKLNLHILHLFPSTVCIYISVDTQVIESDI